MATYSIQAQGDYTYADLLDWLAEQARGGSDFSFGPLDPATLQASGLTLVTEDDKLVERLTALNGVAVIPRR